METEGESLATNYRKDASYCRVKAARARHPEDKARWLEFADTWEKLPECATELRKIFPRRRPQRSEVLEPLPVVILGLRRQFADRHVFDHAPAP
jgi:hypothetical protein